MRNPTASASSALIFALAAGLSGCAFSLFESKPEKGALPSFDETRAFHQIKEYEKLGPAVPGTKESTATGDWIVARLKEAGVAAIEQKSTAETFDHHTIPIRNLIGRINPAAKKRYFFSAHWDARPFADQETDPKLRAKPVPAVNDGGSGVVVLLGIAEALKDRKLPFGVDLLFLDAEDWGSPSSETGWCLGTQHFAKHPIPDGYSPEFGVNLDMVGRMGAVFPIEINSLERAGGIVKKIRDSAKKAGFSDYFPDFSAGPVIDDHIYLMDGLKVPVADIIHMTPGGRFPPEWHTVKDTSDVISRVTLRVAGQTLLQLLWDED